MRLAHRLDTGDMKHRQRPRQFGALGGLQQPAERAHEGAPVQRRQRGMAVGGVFQPGLMHADPLQLLAQPFGLLHQFEEAGLHGRRQSLFGGAQHGGDVDGGRMAVRGRLLVARRLAAGKAALPPGRRDRGRNVSRGIDMVDHRTTPRADWSN